MRIYASRDSVAAGDDVDAPNARSFTFAADTALDEALRQIQAGGYLPRISGGEASWSVASGRPVAVLAQQWTHPRMLLHRPEELKELEWRSGVLRLHFNYHAQVDPERVYQVLREYRPHAI
jgi:hypothetical protein